MLEKNWKNHLQIKEVICFPFGAVSIANVQNPMDFVTALEKSAVLFGDVFLDSLFGSVVRVMD
ncbi:hypothetical protein [Aggregatibacter aphrophilus]|uniref:Uncharacterized protein n=1 Tax=Aggregatibacter aphrophilus TaxID=732 RepID=A0ABX9VRA6_AGGAP|nr:hypothetical protein [Aggregatibacter aphrophilus]RMW78110.1 hypothetical protein DOL88_11130 [Aggregatibacter aphrophilus]